MASDLDFLNELEDVPNKPIKIPKEKSKAKSVKYKPVTTKIETVSIQDAGFQFNQETNYPVFQKDDLMEKWVSDVKKFFQDFLDKYVYDVRKGDPTSLGETPKAVNFKKWLFEKNHFDPVLIALTHQSADEILNYDKNLEKLGDKILGSAAVRLMILVDTQMNLKLDSDDYNNYVSKYLAKEELSNTAKAINLINLSRYRGRATESLQEDSVEALIGAIFTIGEMYSVGYGYFLAERFIFHLMFDKDLLGLTFSPEEIANAKPAQTFFKNIADLIKKANESILTDDYKDGCYTFHLRGKLLETINEYNKSISNSDYVEILPSEIVKVYSDSKKIAKKRAYEEAKKIFFGFGLDDFWYVQFKLSKRLPTWSLKDDDISKLIAKMKSKGAISLNVENNDKIIDDPSQNNFSVFYVELYFKDGPRIIKQRVFHKTYYLEEGKTRKDKVFRSESVNDILMNWIYE
jgi:dsRNA-specific ribonuclease/predicted house-cleaning noncanonical NTP pyrophosphatase (MazG superfamily)